MQPYLKENERAEVEAVKIDYNKANDVTMMSMRRVKRKKCRKYTLIKSKITLKIRNQTMVDTMRKKTL